jgi:glycosyltransferase involved in cell wall biosynthesis
MKIVYVCADAGIPLDGTKGASAHVRELVRALVALGHDVSVVVTRGGVEDEVPARVYEVPISELTFVITEAVGVEGDLQRLLHNLTLEASLGSIFDREMPHLIIERYSLFSVVTGCLARKYGLPFILEVNAPLAWEAAQFRGLACPALAEKFERQAWMQADRIVTVSETLRDLIVEQGIPAEKIIIIPNGVDPERFHPQMDGHSLAMQLGLRGKFVVGFVGSLKPWHGLDTLFVAFRQLVSDQRFHLLIVGDGQDRALIEELAAGLSGRVTLVGAVPHDAVPSYLQVMDVVVAPYAPLPHFYFSPLKVLEAMACGKAVIASRLGQLTEIIDDGRTGVLVPPSDGNALASAIWELADNPDKKVNLGREAMRHASAHYTWKRAARQIGELGESLRASMAAEGGQLNGAD